MSRSAQTHRTLLCRGLVLALAVPGVTGCKDVVERVRQSVMQAGSDPIALPKLVAPDAAASAGFGQALVQAARAADVEGLAALVDGELLAARATLGLELPPEAVEGLRRQLFAAAKARGVFSTLVGSATEGGGVRYLEAKSRLEGGQRWVTFRVLQPSTAFDHYRFLLTKRADGKVQAVDWQLLSLGESISSQMRRLLLPAQGDRLRAVAALLSDEEAALLRHAQPITELQLATQANNPRRALEIFESMPRQAQQLKAVLLTRITAAQAFGDREYRAALQALLEQHPNDPAALVHAIDLHTLQGDHAAALRAIQRLCERAGPDPYFHVLRANKLAEMKDIAGARSAALQALQEEPELHAARFALMKIALQNRDWTDTARWLGELDAHGAVNLPGLRSVAGFAEFAASKHYAQLLSQSKGKRSR